MKIGIISINAHTKVLNFASPLHTYAFQEFLRQNNIESTIIDYKPVYYGEFDVRHPLFYYIEHPDKSAKKQKRFLKKWKTLFYEREYRFDRFEEFIEKYYKKTDRCYTAEILEKEDPGFDCYLCVTDVIWKYNPHTGFDRGFLLACEQMRGKKKIAYSASRGVKGYTSAQEREFLQYIGDFDAISVREKSLQEYIKGAAGMDVSHVLDPVFLHEADFYYDLAIEPEESADYILAYIVMERPKKLIKQVEEFAKATGLKVILMSENWDDADLMDGVDCEYVYASGVEEWLGYMKNAAYIFTNSFHACCFSILFHRQFFAGERSGDKIDSLLALFDLTWRRTSIPENGKAHDMRPIDFAPVDEARRALVESSKAFILDAIEEAAHREHTPLIPDMDAFLDEWDKGRGRELKEKEEQLARQEAREKDAAAARKKQPSLSGKIKNKIKGIFRA